jgi:peptidoglycan hydrolase-like protein with peptidoglycan-binding domain
MLHGEDVKTVQRIVKAPVDGWYGPDTAADVKRWQRAHGLTADGEVGPKTAGKMGLRWTG